MATYTGADKRLQYLFEHGGGGGGSANIWTGTKAEYLEQASQIEDGTQINITDDEIQSLVVASYDIYSTQEREVGVWHDGKPLYQRTIITPFSNKAKGSRSWITILEENTGVSPKVVFGTMSVDNYTTFVMNGVGHDFADASTTNYAYSTYAITSAGGINAVIRQYFYDGAASGYFTTTVKYTKDADVAGSGLFVPSGALAHHYTTDEQVVGTWVDGSTLYEKTFSYNSVSSGDNTFAFDLPAGAIVVDQKNAFFVLSQSMYFSDNNVSGNSINLVNTDKDRTVINVAGVLAPYIDDVKITVKYIKTA